MRHHMDARPRVTPAPRLAPVSCPCDQFSIPLQATTSSNTRGWYVAKHINRKCNLWVGIDRGPYIEWWNQLYCITPQGCSVITSFFATNCTTSFKLWSWLEQRHGIHAPPLQHMNVRCALLWRLRAYYHL